MDQPSTIPISKFSYLVAVLKMCNLLKIETKGILRLLPNQDSTMHTFVVEFSCAAFKVYASGSSTNMSQAKMMACKNALIQIVYHLRLCEPTLSIANYCLTEEDLNEYGRQLPNKQSSFLAARSIWALFQLRRAENATNSAAHPKEAKLELQSNAKPSTTSTTVLPTIYRPKFNYGLALQQLCHHKLKNGGYTYKTPAIQTTGTESKITATVELFYLNDKMQASGSGADVKEARSEACKSALIKLIPHLRVREPGLSLAQYGLTQKDLAEHGRTLACSDHKLTSGPGASVSGNAANPAVLFREADLKTLNNARPSISSSTVSVNYRPKFNYGLALQQLCHHKLKNGGYIYKTPAIQTPGAETKTTVIVELVYLNDKMQASGSGADVKEARSEACKSALIKLIPHLRVREPGLSLAQYGLTQTDLAEHGRTISKATENAANPAVQTKASIASPTVSSTSFQPKFNYLAAMYRFCNHLNVDTSDFLKELPNQSGSAEFTFMLEIDLGAKVQAFGSGPSKTQARMKACKNGFIQIVHFLRVCDPTLSLDEYGLSEDEVTNYRKNLTNEQTKDSAKAVLFLMDRMEKVKNLAIQTKAAESNGRVIGSIDGSTVSSTIQVPSYGYAIHEFCHLRSDASYALEELTDQSSDAQKKFKLEIRYSDVKLEAFGSGLSRKEAKSETFKNGLIKLVNHLRIRDPALSLTKLLSLTKNELSDYYRRVAFSDQTLTSALGAKATEIADSTEATKETEPLTGSGASINFLTPSSSSTSSNWREDIVLFRRSSSLAPNGETLSNRSVGLFAKAPSANGFQHANGLQRARHSSDPPEIKKERQLELESGETQSETKIDIQESSATVVEQPVAKIGEQESLLAQVQKLLSEIGIKSKTDSELKNSTSSAFAPASTTFSSDHNSSGNQSDWKTVQETVAYLEENRNVFEEIVKLHDENATISYTKLIRKFVKLMPQRKLKYEFHESDTGAFGVCWLLYEDRCFQTAYGQSLGSDLVDLEEICAKKIFYGLKLNYMN